MTVSKPPIPASDTVVLPPLYWLPLGVVLLALPLCWLTLWAGGPILVFGLFLCFQTATDTTALHQNRPRTLPGPNPDFAAFPMQDWLNWEIFWSPHSSLVLF